MLIKLFLWENIDITFRYSENVTRVYRMAPKRNGSLRLIMLSSVSDTGVALIRTVS